MNKRNLIVLFTAVFLIMFVSSIKAQNSGAGAKKDKQPIWLSDCEDKIDDLGKSNQVEPLSDFLPFFGKKIREMGYSLPLPFGVGMSFMVMRQTNKISNFKLIIDGEDVPYDIKFYNAVSTDVNVSFRPDIWILPFLNVYAVMGKTSGNMKPTILIPGIQVDLPNLGEIDIVKPIEITDEINYKGTTAGFGTTLAGGFKSYFFTVDYNYTWTNLDVITQTVTAQTLTPRIGVILDSYKTKGTGTLWLGAMYIDINETIVGSVNLRELDPEVADIIGDELNYSMDIGVTEPWNFLIGGAWGFHPRMTLVLEAGIGDRSQFLASIDYRF
ncbi:MAG: hypothetical protein L3J34_03405 [Flavobacteriaceae bacterium]|nr:hypothetical protein [Flavobacteriaceae bacterium]